MGLSDLAYLFSRANQPTHVAATPTQVYATTKRGMVTALNLTAGVDAATAVVRDGDGSGTIIASLSAAAGTSQPESFPAGMIFTAGLHVTLTGTAPTLDVVGVGDDL